MATTREELVDGRTNQQLVEIMGGSQFDSTNYRIADAELRVRAVAIQADLVSAIQTANERMEEAAAEQKDLNSKIFILNWVLAFLTGVSALAAATEAYKAWTR